jgi:hypothetical protein
VWKGFFRGSRPLLVVPVPAGRTLPEFPTDGTPGIALWASLPGAEASEHDDYTPSSDPARYVFTKADDLRNLYRIPLTGR